MVGELQVGFDKKTSANWLKMGPLMVHTRKILYCITENSILA
jgi:hypothetical protein